jgi:CubicO group peptidase (beta-lactamase class C family)
MPSIRRAVLAPAFLLAACAPMSARRAAPSAAPPPALDEQAPRWLAEHGVPSIAIAYVRDGAVQWTRVYGEQAQGVPATDRTLYNVASLTKPLFAELMLRLAADGRLSLDEPMAPYWTDPDVAADPRHAILTPRLALSHRTGFANWRRETEGVLRIGFQPGTQFRYSGEGFEYARRFAQNRVGASIDSLARQYVFRPLGMRDIAFTRQPWFAGRVAVPRGSEGRWGEPSLPDTANAADDVHTTVGDYGRFLAAVMDRDGLPAAFADQRDSIHAMGGDSCDPARVPVCPVRIGYGLGWSIMEYADANETVIWHTGSDWGEKAMVFYFPGRREGVVMLTNGANGFLPMIDIGILLFPDREFAGFLRAGKP